MIISNNNTIFEREIMIRNSDDNYRQKTVYMGGRSIADQKA